MNTLRTSLFAAVLCMGTLHGGNAVAAQSFDACTGFIDTVPATISTPGVWCLRKDLSTSISIGAAITIAANNVTIDCNDFKLGGLAAGPASNTAGIYLAGRQNGVVRNCNLRGFHEGVRFDAGAGHLVEDNRFDHSLVRAVYFPGVASGIVRRNRIYDTGGHPAITEPRAIEVANTDVLDNIVSDVSSSTGTAVYGIVVAGSGSVTVHGNQVRGLDAASGTAYGIRIQSPELYAGVVDNFVAAWPLVEGVGVMGANASRHRCGDNMVGGFEILIDDCWETGGNYPP